MITLFTHPCSVSDCRPTYSSDVPETHPSDANEIENLCHSSPRVIFQCLNVVEYVFSLGFTCKNIISKNLYIYMYIQLCFLEKVVSIKGDMAN